MKVRRTVIAAMVIIAACLRFTSDLNYVYASDKQGTDGTEINAYEPEELEIYLGSDWAGKEFKLETDAGIYPNAVAVGEDGLLKVEIGGSKNYKLTVMEDDKDTVVGDASVSEDESSQDNEADENQENIEITDSNEDDKKQENESNDAVSAEEIPEGAVTQPPVNDEGTSVTETKQDGEVQVEWTKEEDNKKGFTVFGIPLKHLIIFIVGMIIAIDGLIIINLIQKKRREDYEDGYYYDDYDEEYYDEDYEDEYEDGYDDEYED